jgi:tetratricopeptide (TPR) repeat protein
VLRSLDEKFPLETVRFIADKYDGLAVAGGGGWTEVVGLKKSKPTVVKDYAERRHQFHERIADGHVDRALELKLIETADASGAVMLQIDARQMQGTALMLAERPADAVAAFDDAVRLAAKVSPHQTTYLLLLESDARRRAGDGAAAAQTWQQAIVLAAQLLDAAPPVLDPVLWERLSYLRPVNTPWPADVVGQLLDREPLAGIELTGVGGATASDEGANPADADTVIWHSIGRWYLDRGHAQAGLVSFKRAETSAQDAGTRNWLRFRQAKSLIVLGQVSPATAILVGLLAQKPPAVEAPASALLGSLYVNRGQTPRGLQLLKKGIERKDPLTWHERSEAEADLGLAYLSMGDAVTGLDQLHRAQHSFETEGELESLVAALENELKYLEHAGKKKETGAVKTRLRELETGK